MPLFVGIDVGTQGVRVICSDQYGNTLAGSSRTFGPEVAVAGLAAGWNEQHPEYWWKLAVDAIADVMRQINASGARPEEIAAVAVDSTSGTIFPVGSRGEVLRPALMYNDSRASEESNLCNQTGVDLCDKLGYRFSSSFALPKIVWMLRNEPHIVEKTYKIIHAADFLVGKMTGDYTVSDYSNALKTGYDLVELRWPDFIADKLEIDLGLLPNVVRPGEELGSVNSECSEVTGLPTGCKVVAGVTDGTAGFFASGASDVGDWNSTLGTTLVLRGISDNLIEDPKGRLYCHLSPDGMWLPGAAGNVGGECLAKLFSGKDYKSMDLRAMQLSPSGVSVYPLVRQGERFPFLDSRAEGFVSAANIPEELLYTAYLEGVAYVERWCYETAQSLGAPLGNVIYTTGGGAKSREWMQLRSDVLQCDLVRPKNTESAMGTAVIAASRTFYKSCSEAVANMVREDVRVSPRQDMSAMYHNAYSEFRRECAARGLGV